MGFVIGQSRDQGSLFPVVLDDLVPQEHLVRVIDAFVSRLDLVGLGFGKAEPAATGRPPYDPGDLLKLYLYGYLNQVRSSRKLERECGRNVELMWLVNRLAPDFKTIAEFRRQNGAALRAVGGAFLSFCRQAGLIGGEWVAIDGSKFQAVASRKKAVTVKQLQRQQAGIEKRIAAYLEQLEVADRQEEQAEAQPDAQALRAALTQLRSRAADAASAEGLLKALGETQHVVGEPEAKLMKTGEGAAKVAYNVQSAVDAQHQLIVAHEVTQELSDNRSLLPMAQQAKRSTGAETLKVVADAGYSNAEQAARCEANGILPYVPANRSGNNQGDGRYFDKITLHLRSGHGSLSLPGRGVAHAQTTVSPPSHVLLCHERLRGLCAQGALHGRQAAYRGPAHRRSGAGARAGAGRRRAACDGAAPPDRGAPVWHPPIPHL